MDSLYTLLVASFVAACALLGGCANPVARADRIAADSGYEKLRLNGSGLAHVAYFKPGDGGDVLHVYIEHDGTPWMTPTQPAPDPTPTNPLMLKMMSLDGAPALYLGRPCYFGPADAPPCEPIWWTHRRFAAEVIASMDAALRSFLVGHPEFAALEFYGYSGGGVVATLMAPGFAATRRLVTVAAPLDLDGWTRLHDYAPLAGSLRPLDQPPLSSGVAQLHLAGGQDDVVPAYLIRAFVDRQAAAELRSIPRFTHTCCWESLWQDDVLMHGQEARSCTKVSASSPLLR